ncbi:hypothetical protein J6590_032622 [Homalodisca vitripennis]|nr:hypothetical protein J6590_032622 [Homalodisca vitripennis]
MGIHCFLGHRTQVRRDDCVTEAVESDCYCLSVNVFRLGPIPIGALEANSSVIVRSLCTQRLCLRDVTNQLLINRWVTPSNYNNGTRSGPEKPSRNPGLRSESAGAGNGQELTPPIWQAL